MGEFLYCCMICACRRECIKCDLTVDNFLNELDMIQVADMFQKLLAEYVTVDKQPKKGQTISELLGVAVGEIGMSIADFDALAPSEFSTIAESYHTALERQSRERWEIARFNAMFALLPYSKKKLKPQDIVVFEWETKKAATHKRQPKQSAQEIRTRYREVIGGFE